MGSKEKYADYYDTHKGFFYYTPGFVEIGYPDDDAVWDRRYQMYLTRYKGSEKKARRAVEIEKSFTDSYQFWEKIQFSGSLWMECGQKKSSLLYRRDIR